MPKKFSELDTTELSNASHIVALSGTKNNYVNCTIEASQFARESEVVHIGGQETIIGNKEFTGENTFSNRNDFNNIVFINSLKYNTQERIFEKATQNVNPKSNEDTTIALNKSEHSAPDSDGINTWIDSKRETNGAISISLNCKKKVNGEYKDSQIITLFDENGVAKAYAPTTLNDANSNEIATANFTRNTINTTINTKFRVATSKPASMEPNTFYFITE